MRHIFYIIYRTSSVYVRLTAGSVYYRFTIMWHLSSSLFFFLLYMVKLRTEAEWCLYKETKLVLVDCLSTALTSAALLSPWETKMRKIALGSHHEAAQADCLRAVLAEIVLTFLFVFAGVGSAMASGKRRQEYPFFPLYTSSVILIAVSPSGN